MGSPCPAGAYRFVVLLFNCLLTFGSYFCFDIPSVLQEQFQGVSAGPSSEKKKGRTSKMEALVSSRFFKPFLMMLGRSCAPRSPVQMMGVRVAAGLLAVKRANEAGTSREGFGFSLLPGELEI